MGNKEEVQLLEAEKAFVNIGNKEKVKRLIQLFVTNKYSGKHGARTIAAETLKDIEYKEALTPLILFLKEEDNMLRQTAAEVLGKTRSEEAVRPLILALKDEDNLVRESAAEALESIGSEGAVKPLLLALKDKKEGVRARAASALWHITKTTSYPRFYDATFPQANPIHPQPNNSIISFLSCQIKSHRLRELN